MVLFDSASDHGNVFNLIVLSWSNASLFLMIGSSKARKRLMLRTTLLVRKAGTVSSILVRAQNKNSVIDNLACMQFFFWSRTTQLRLFFHKYDYLTESFIC